jgi:hypothetical protein
MRESTVSNKKKLSVASDNNMTNSAFNIYYINFSKVYEISMMINNVVISSIQRENSTQLEKGKKIHSIIESEAGSKEYLAKIKSVLGSEISEKNTQSSKMIESLDVKTTKSILLRRIYEKCSFTNDILKCVEGDLVKLDKVKLRILNEENLRQFKILRSDALKGFRVEGMEINNLISSMLQDYSYILCGRLENTDEEIVIKIPMEFNNEFESKYNVDDLLIGSVSVIGVYKGEVTEKFINTNTFNYLYNLGMQQPKEEKKVIQSSYPVGNGSQPLAFSDKTYKFIDIIAIIQDIHFKQAPLTKVKVPWYKSIFRFRRK